MSGLVSTQETAAALQGRLDAELTSRAEVERSLAELRRQRLEDDRKAVESREELMHQITALQIERGRTLEASRRDFSITRAGTYLEMVIKALTMFPS